MNYIWKLSLNRCLFKYSIAFVFYGGHFAAGDKGKVEEKNCKGGKEGEWIYRVVQKSDNPVLILR